MRRTYDQKTIRKQGTRIRKRLLVTSFISIVLLIHTSSFGNPTFTDDLNRQVTPKTYPPQRIISLAPNITEILYAIHADEQLIADTDFCKYPKEAQGKEKIGGFINPNLEKIVSLTPDLIIVTADSNQDKIFNQLSKLKLPIYVTNPGNLNTTLLDIQKIGMVTGKKENADKLTTSLKQRIETIIQKVKGASKPKVLFLWSEEPLITAGKNTFTNDLIEQAGGINIAGDSKIRYPKFSTEEILKRKPDIIISSAMETNQDKSTLLERWKGWVEIPAIKNKKVYTISIDLLARPAPSMVDGFEALAKIIHPEIFNINGK